MASTFSRLFDFLGSFTAAGRERRAREQTMREQVPTPAPQAPPRPRRDPVQAHADLKQQRDEQRAVEEERRQQDPLWRFINMGEVKSFQSSNVHSAFYEQRNQALFVQFLAGSLYRYENVNTGEAESMYRSVSAGTWVWDNLRIRGTKLGHRKDYQMVFSGAQERRWEETPERARAHAERAAAESGAPNVMAKLGKFALNRPVTNRGRRPRPGR